MKKIIKKLDPDEVFAMHYRVTVRQHEYIAHLAFDTHHNSKKKIIDEGTFKRKWLTKLEELKEKHRRLGYQDYLFWPAELRRRFGYKVPMGRPKKPMPIRKK